MEKIKNKVGRPKVVKPAKAPKGAPKKELAQRKFGLNLNQTDLKMTVSGALIQSKFNGDFAQFWAALGGFISGLESYTQTDLLTPKQDIPCL
jgi:hypothetical protein